MSDKLIFSVYKYSHELILEGNNIENEEFEENHVTYISETVKQTLEYLKKRLDKNVDTEYTQFSIEEGAIQGLYFCSSNPPVWKNFVESSIKKVKALKDSDITVANNVSSSYIILITYNKSIYMITGGQGARYLTPFIDGYFGIDVLPGLISETEASIKGLENINFTGNRQSESFMNTKLTSITDEISMRSLNKKLNIEVSLSKVNQTLGIDILENENRDKVIKIESKDSIILQRGLTEKELIKVIANLDKIYETRRDEYVLNYFIPAKKEKLSKKIIEEQLAVLLAQGETGKFSIVGDNYYEYYTGADKYILLDEKSDIVLEKDNEEITLKDCYRVFEGKEIKLTKTFMTKFLKKWRIKTVDQTEAVLMYPTPIIRVLQGQYNLIENRGGNEVAIPMFLMNGEWFAFNKKYMNTLDRRFEQLFDDNDVLLSNLPFLELITNRQNEEGITNENNYNASFYVELNNNVIVAHPILIHNVEFSDLIMWDDDNLYLLCVKGSFNGEGVRDLTNQMWASAQILNNVINSQHRTTELEKYYNKIKLNYDQEYQFEELISLKSFINLFDKQIVYIAGYIKSYRKDSQATYAKLLTLDYKNSFKRNFGADYFIVGDLIGD